MRRQLILIHPAGEEGARDAKRVLDDLAAGKDVAVPDTFAVRWYQQPDDFSWLEKALKSVALTPRSKADEPGLEVDRDEARATETPEASAKATAVAGQGAEPAAAEAPADAEAEERAEPGVSEAIAQDLLLTDLQKQFGADVFTGENATFGGGYSPTVLVKLLDAGKVVRVKRAYAGNAATYRLANVQTAAQAVFGDARPRTRAGTLPLNPNVTGRGRQ